MSHSNLAESQNAVCLNGAGHDGDSPDATSSDASTHNFWTLMLAGRWSALAGGDGAGRAYRVAIDERELVCCC